MGKGAEKGLKEKGRRRKARRCMRAKVGNDLRNGQ